MQDCKEADILIVTTTVGSRGDAERLARELVERRLAACVQLDAGVRSFYRWEGKVCEDEEIRLTIKTAPGRAAALQAAIKELHPYDVPQYVAWAASATAGYAGWARAETAPA